MNYTAILFDFDGVLGKTMEDNYRAWADALGRIGVRITPDEYFLLEGLNAAAVAEALLKKHKLPVALAPEMVTLKECHYSRHNQFSFYPGVPSLIGRIKERFSLALVSGAGKKRLHQTVPPDFLTNFGAVVTGDDVGNPKPDPEPYVAASRILGVAPRACLVVENAPLGIQAAKEANMDCLAVCSTLQRNFLHQADFIVEDAPAMIRFLDDINDRGQ
jgi:HAD superfamily hydrolase (TIGR01509 family)